MVEEINPRPAKKKRPAPTVSYPLVMVRWLDAYGGSQTGWRSIVKITKEMVPSEAISVGYLVLDDDDRIVIVPHLVAVRTDSVDGDGEIVIPKGWVQDVLILRIGEAHTWRKEP